VFNHSWSVLSALATIAVFPLVSNHPAQQSAPPNQTVSVQILAAPVTLGVQIATVIRPLDLANLTNADFGDLDSHN
jgi:hypothetical protein